MRRSGYPSRSNSTQDGRFGNLAHRFAPRPTEYHSSEDSDSSNDQFEQPPRQTARQRGAYSDLEAEVEEFEPDSSLSDSPSDDLFEVEEVIEHPLDETKTSKKFICNRSFSNARKSGADDFNYAAFGGLSLQVLRSRNDPSLYYVFSERDPVRGAIDRKGFAYPPVPFEDASFGKHPSYLAGTTTLSNYFSSIFVRGELSQRLATTGSAPRMLSTSNIRERVTTALSEPIRLDHVALKAQLGMARDDIEQIQLDWSSFQAQMVYQTLLEEDQNDRNPLREALMQLVISGIEISRRNRVAREQAKTNPILYRGLEVQPKTMNEFYAFYFGERWSSNVKVQTVKPKADKKSKSKEPAVEIEKVLKLRIDPGQIEKLKTVAKHLHWPLRVAETAQTDPNGETAPWTSFLHAPGVFERFGMMKALIAHSKPAGKAVAGLLEDLRADVEDGFLQSGFYINEEDGSGVRTFWPTTCIVPRVLAHDKRFTAFYNGWCSSTIDVEVRDIKRQRLSLQSRHMDYFNIVPLYRNDVRNEEFFQQLTEDEQEEREEELLPTIWRREDFQPTLTMEEIIRLETTSRPQEQAGPESLYKSKDLAITDTSPYRCFSNSEDCGSPPTQFVRIANVNALPRTKISNISLGLLKGPNDNDQYRASVAFEMTNLQGNEDDFTKFWLDGTACNGVPVPVVRVPLMYNVRFVRAPDCADELVLTDEHDCHMLTADMFPTFIQGAETLQNNDFKWTHDNARVLVIMASEHTRTVTLARARCSQWGLDAVELGPGTCIACGVRLAMAAKIKVVIVARGALFDSIDQRPALLPTSADMRKKAESQKKSKTKDKAKEKTRSSKTKEQPSQTKERSSSTKERSSSTKERPSSTKERPSREKTPSSSRDGKKPRAHSKRPSTEVPPPPPRPNSHKIREEQPPRPRHSGDSNTEPYIEPYIEPFGRPTPRRRSSAFQGASSSSSTPNYHSPLAPTSGVYCTDPACGGGCGLPFRPLVCDDPTCNGGCGRPYAAPTRQACIGPRCTLPNCQYHPFYVVPVSRANTAGSGASFGPGAGGRPPLYRVQNSNMGSFSSQNPMTPRGSFGGSLGGSYSSFTGEAIDPNMMDQTRQMFSESPELMGDYPEFAPPVGQAYRGQRRQSSAGMSYMAGYSR